VKRRECLAAIYDELARCAVVTIMGAVAAELYGLGHQPNFFYLQHAMGLAPSLGLGIALTLPGRRVVVLDGDGSLLMNLGGLATLAGEAPQNLTHIVFDNQSLVSIGGFPTPTAQGVDLAAAARAAGITSARTVTDLDEFTTAVHQAISADELTCLVAKVEADVVTSFAMDLHLLENRFAFARSLRGSDAAQP
jgi:sulfopyruvate decarboxylase subunit beta